MGRVEQRLDQLGITLPATPKPVANYVPAKRVGNLVYVAGQVSALAGREYRGQLGGDRGAEEGQEATRACAINCLAALLSVVDSLDRLTQIVHVGGFVNSAQGFQGQAAAMNGASDLLVEVFGEAGKHTRTAVGVSGLPLDYTASVYLIAEVA
ncbi:MAG TPA: RidA family protein [bacterium]|nr:RidA family protein [bacterium]